MSDLIYSYSITISKVADSQCRNDLFAVTCAQDGIIKPLLIELARTRFIIRDCYPRSKLI